MKRWQAILDVALAAIGCLVVTLFLRAVPSFPWNVRTTSVADATLYRLPATASVFVGAIGIALIVLGLRLGLERQFYNWLLVTAGASLTILGTSYIAGQELRVDRDSLQVRSWWGAWTERWPYDDMNRVEWVHHIAARRRRPHWQSVECVSRSGERRVIIADTNDSALFRMAELELKERLASRGVTIKRRSEGR